MTCRPIAPPIALAVLLGSVLTGCAQRPASQVVGLQALPHPGGKILLTWTPGAGAEGVVIQRRAEGEAWRVIAETDAPQAPPFVDEVGPVRRQFSYRVASRASGRLSDWSDAASSVPTFVNKPLWGWLNVADYDTCAVPGVRDPQPIQCAIQDLGGGPDISTLADGPHVLFFPDGEYDISSTLFVEGRAGVQFVGESKGGVVLRWMGRRGTTPDDATVMFHAEGNRDATFRNLVWDGNCDDPDRCYVVAFDQSFCGTSDGKIPRNNDCGRGGLGWPERADLGFTDNGGAHFDSEFRNAYVGLRLGHHGVADDTTTLRRCRFVDNFAGVSLEDFNALHHWFWDPTFQRNYVGITNDLADVRRGFDRDYRPGRCVGQAGEPACFDGSDCDSGVRCERPSHWGGDFAVYRGRFIDNRHTDVWAQPTGEFIVRDSWSAGAGRFFFGAGPNASRASYSLIRNTVWGGDEPTIVTRGPGTFLLLDNRLFTDGAGPAVRSDALMGLDPAVPDAGAIDLVSVGNQFSTAQPYDFRSRHRLRESGRRAPQAAEPANVPPPPRAVDPLNDRPVYTVTEARGNDAVANARRIQRIIDAALNDPQPAVVHFPGGGGRFPIAETLRIPAGAELTLAGDGAFTTLWWTGPAGQPALEIDAAGARGVTVRDLQVLRAGIVVKNLDGQEGRVFASQLRLDENAVAGLVLQELDNVRVDVADYKSSFGLLAAEGVFGTVVDVGSTVAPAGAVAVWSGDTGRNQTDYLVLNDTAGARLLVTGNYMEKSRQHLRIDGNGAGGQVTFLGGKFAPTVVLADPDDPDELARATATVAVEDFAGSLGLLQSQMFVVSPQQSGDSHPKTVAHGARIRVVGSRPLELDIVALGLALRRQPAAGREQDPLLDDPEYDFSAAGPNRVRYLRLAGKRSARYALPLADVDAVTGRAVRPIAQVLDEGAESRLLRSLELVRELEPPGFYDEVGADEPPPIRFDKVFVYKAAPAMILAAGVPCIGIDDCATVGDGPSTCDRRGIPTGLPGRCRPTVQDP